MGAGQISRRPDRQKLPSGRLPVSYLTFHCRPRCGRSWLQGNSRVKPGLPVGGTSSFVSVWAFPSHTFDAHSFWPSRGPCRCSRNPRRMTRRVLAVLVAAPTTLTSPGCRFPTCTTNWARSASSPMATSPACPRARSPVVAVAMRTPHNRSPLTCRPSRVLNALGGPQQVNLLLTGHSHFDHSFDTGTWATLTGAPIVGSKTTCLQVRAERVPAKRCSVVNGGEKRVLATGVTMYIVRWNHSGDPATNPEQHNAVELADVPHPDPATGGLRAGVAEDFPNGGGNRAFLFVVDGPQGRFSWFFQNSASAVDLTVPIVVDGVNYGAPLANLQRALGQLLHTVRTRPRCTVQKLHSGAHAECVGHSVGSTRTVHGQVATEHKRHLADCEQRRARRTGIQETVIFRMLDCANRRTTGNR